jgi:ABC-type tungstate transport system substrate-binding protein
MSTFADSWRLAWTLIVDGDAELWRIAMLSLQVSGIAVGVGSVAGLLLGAWLAVARFPGHGVFVWAVNTLLALPAVVVGLLVYLLLSRAGPLGPWGLLFTPTAMVVAQSVLVTPLIAALSLEPVTVTSMICVAVPSLLFTLSVSCTVWPAVSACVVALLLSSAYVHAPLLVLNVKVP